MLESIKLLQASLQQTKHGQKVLSKLQKAYPHIFTASASGSSTNKAKQGQNGSGQGNSNNQSQQKKKSGNKKGQKARQGAKQAP